MNDHLKLYHKVLSVMFILICGLIIISFGWIGFATFTERAGNNGDLYYYYKLTRSQFYVFNFVIVLIALVLIGFQIKYLIQKNPKYLTMTFWAFAIFMSLIIIAEIYLETRFNGKG